LARHREGVKSTYLLRFGDGGDEEDDFDDDFDDNCWYFDLKWVHSAAFIWEKEKRREKKTFLSRVERYL
jgi:hypothetical protein